MNQRCVYLHCCLCLDSMSIICSCLCHAASVVSVPAMPLAPAEGGWTPPRAPPPPPPYSITAVAPYSALSLLPSAVLRRSQHGAGPLSMPHTQLLSIFPSFFFLPHPFFLLSFSLSPLFALFSIFASSSAIPTDNIGQVSLREGDYSSLGGRNTGDPDWRASKQRPKNRDATYPFALFRRSLTKNHVVVVVLLSFLSFTRRLGPLLQENLKPSLVRGYSRTYRFALHSGQGASSFSLSYEK